MRTNRRKNSPRPTRKHIDLTIAGWQEIIEGDWRSEGVFFNDQWYAPYYKDGKRTLDGVPTATYYRQDLGPEGCTESHLIVGEDGYAQED